MEGQALRPRSTPMFIVLLCIFVNHCAAISVFAGDRPVAWASRVLGGYEQVSRTNGSEAGECPRVFNFTRDGSTFGFVRNFRHVPDVMPKVGNDLIPFIGPRRTSLTNDESFLDPYHQTILPHRRINADGKECGTSQENSYLYLSKIDLGPEMSGAGCSMVYGEDHPTGARTCGDNVQVGVTMFTNCMPAYMDELEKSGQTKRFASSNGTWYMGIYNYIGAEPFGCWYKKTLDAPVPPVVVPVPSFRPTPTQYPQVSPPLSTTPLATPLSSSSASPGSQIDAIDDAESACFPASGRVILEDGIVKRMDELAIGDRILVGKDQYSPIFAFTHRDSSAKHSFVRLIVDTGYEEKHVELTKTHYLYLNGNLALAGTAQLGDTVVLADGSERAVVRIEEHRLSGLFNPQTIDGNIVVDDILASTYTARIPPSVAHATLSVFRLAYKLVGLDVSNGALEQLSLLDKATSWGRRGQTA